ncbi:MAG: histidine--tRNA ligase [Gammaproteobacteria bacterium]|nr:histidine--tRNA ligase [Gammaproteobacteria bacterium]
MEKNQNDLVEPRIPGGFADSFANDVMARRWMIERVQAIYEKYGFELLETPALEYVDTLGKFLPESETPQGGVFSLRDEDEQWIALRYDLTAPLSRVVAQYGTNLPVPFRRCQYGPVWRMEKPGPGRFRQFYQLDFDTVGTPSMAADAEVCAVLSEGLESLGINRGDYSIRVNNRKILNGVLETIGLSLHEESNLAVLRAIDKLDRLGIEGVEALLGEGRLDPTGAFAKGANLSSGQKEAVLQFLKSGEQDRVKVCANLKELVADSDTGLEGIRELEQIHELLEVTGVPSTVFDPSVVRGLAYYTGPVFEAALTFEVNDEKGEKRPFGSIAGGGRYDDLVKRFTGAKVPATGASIGIDRLLAALKAMDKLKSAQRTGPTVIAVLDQQYLIEYQRMVTELRAAGIPAELYLGTRGLNAQNKYADKRNSRVLVIAGEDEFSRGEIAVKDMVLGKRLSRKIKNRDEWRKGQPAQVSVPRSELVSKVKSLLLDSSANVNSA